MDLKQFIRDIPDFPKPGIIFKDITPLLNHPQAFHEAVDAMAEAVAHYEPDRIVAIESRGFIFGGAISYVLNKGFIPIRKPGKLPFHTIQESYELEYGMDQLEMHQDALKAGERVVVIDDLIATGGTALAAKRLVQKLGGQVVGYVFLVELVFLNGKKNLAPTPVTTLIAFNKG